MNIQTSKIELVKMILNIENDKFIEKITNFIRKEKMTIIEKFYLTGNIIILTCCLLLGLFFFIISSGLPPQD